MSQLRLRPYRASDESVAIAGHEAMKNDNFTFLLAWDPSLSWSTYLDQLEDERWGRNLPADRVRGSQLVADVDGALVGRTSLRFELNEWFKQFGGHVGYGVLPEHRRKGYAKEILIQALVLLRAEGIEEILVTCDDSNVGSAKVIESCGGVLENIVPYDDELHTPIRRYWIR